MKQLHSLTPAPYLKEKGEIFQPSAMAIFCIYLHRTSDNCFELPVRFVHALQTTLYQKGITLK